MRIEDKNLEVNSKKIKFSFENKEYEALEGETVASALTRNGIKDFRKDKSNNYRGVYCNMGICNECIVEINGNQSIKSCTTNIKENDKILIQKYNANLPSLKKNIQLKKQILKYDILIIGAGPGGIGASLSLDGSQSRVALIDEKQTIGIFFESVSNLTKGEVPLMDLVISRRVRKRPEEYRVSNLTLAALLRGKLLGQEDLLAALKAVPMNSELLAYLAVQPHAQRAE